MPPALFTPPMPPLADDRVGGLRVLAGLRRNGFGAFPARCLTEPVIRLRMPGRALVLANAPDAVRHVLQTHAGDFGRLPAGRRILGPIAGRGLLTSEGEAWRRQRRAMAPAFTPRTVPVLAGHIARCADASCIRLAATAAAGTPVDLLAAMQELALDIAAVSMFSLETAAFGAALREAVTRYMATIGRPHPSDFLLPAAVPTPLSLRRSRFRRRWRGLIGGIVGARRAQGEPVDPPRDLFDLMATAYASESDDLLADEVATMIVAGHETTALALFWACLLLAHAPHWQDRVAAEVAGLDLSAEGAPASLQRLPVTRAVVQEALRLYPPAFMTARQALVASTVCGVAVPPGAVVLIPLFLLHRDPSRWDGPDAFDPARFLDRPEPDRYTYLPFGVGPNTCIGAQLAMTEAVLVLARLLRDFALSLDGPDQPVMPVGVLSTRPDHAPSFRLTPRTRDAAAQSMPPSSAALDTARTPSMSDSVAMR